MPPGGGPLGLGEFNVPGDDVDDNGELIIDDVDGEMDDNTGEVATGDGGEVRDIERGELWERGEKLEGEAGAGELGFDWVWRGINPALKRCRGLLIMGLWGAKGSWIREWETLIRRGEGGEMAEREKFGWEWKVGVEGGEEEEEEERSEGLSRRTPSPLLEWDLLWCLQWEQFSNSSNLFSKKAIRVQRASIVS